MTVSHLRSYFDLSSHGLAAHFPYLFVFRCVLYLVSAHFPFFKLIIGRVIFTHN